MNKFDFLAKMFIRLSLGLTAIFAAFAITFAIILAYYTSILVSIISLLALALILFIILIITNVLEKRYYSFITDIKNKIEEMLEDEFFAKYKIYLISYNLKELAFCIEIKEDDINLDYLKSVIDDILSTLNNTSSTTKINLYLNITN